MIITKTQLLSWANEGFPEYYRMVSTQRPRSNADFEYSCVAIRRMKRAMFPEIDRFPTVVSMQIESYRQHEDALFSDVRLEVSADGSRMLCRGSVASNPFNAHCTFEGLDVALRAFCEHFAFNLIFNVLDEEEISFEEWNDLAD